MKLPNYLALISLAAIVVIGGCANSPTAPQTPPITEFSNAFFPLEIGNYWVYCTRTNQTDSIMKRVVVDTVALGGNTYFEVVDTYYGQIKGWRPDTLYLRYRTNDILSFYYLGTDSAYTNFNTFFANSEQSEFPGLVVEYPASDSTTLGRFDSCKVILFGGTGDPLYYSKYVSGIGAIITRYLFGDLCLMKAQIGNTLYP